MRTPYGGDWQNRCGALFGERYHPSGLSPWRGNFGRTGAVGSCGREYSRDLTEHLPWRTLCDHHGNTFDLTSACPSVARLGHTVPRFGSGPDPPRARRSDQPRIAALRRRAPSQIPPDRTLPDFCASKGGLPNLALRAPRSRGGHPERGVHVRPSQVQVSGPSLTRKGLRSSTTL